MSQDPILENILRVIETREDADNVVKQINITRDELDKLDRTYFVYSRGLCLGCAV